MGETKDTKRPLTPAEQRAQILFILAIGAGFGIAAYLSGDPKTVRFWLIGIGMTLGAYGLILRFFGPRAERLRRERAARRAAGKN